MIYYGIGKSIFWHKNIIIWDVVEGRVKYIPCTCVYHIEADTVPHTHL